VNAAGDCAVLDEFVGKWTAASPELRVALRFMAPRWRDASTAFLCLAQEIAQLAFDRIEPAVALPKLEWWSGELARAAAGQAQHPLTRILARLDGFATAPWPAVVTGAAMQWDPSAAPDMTSLLAGYRHLHGPMARAEAQLFRGVDAAASARACDLARAVRELSRVADAAGGERLPLPLDVLARHQIDRAGLALPGAARAAALRDHCASLLRAIDALGDGNGLSLPRVADLASARARLRRAVRADDPLAALAAASGRLPPVLAWTLWRHARRRHPVSY
jgi:phytoene synthase